MYVSHNSLEKISEKSVNKNPSLRAIPPGASVLSVISTVPNLLIRLLVKQETSIAQFTPLRTAISVIGSCFVKGIKN